MYMSILFDRRHGWAGKYKTCLQFACYAICILFEKSATRNNLELQSPFELQKMTIKSNATRGGVI